MRALLFPLMLASFCVSHVTAQQTEDPSKIGIYVTPYYNSKGPDIKVGEYSKGLASQDEAEFIATIQTMKGKWQELTFPVLYVGAIQLYDRGFRNEATYWFYTAQYRGRLFTSMLDRSKTKGIGDPGFELMHAHQSFFQLSGPFINGYAFGDVDKLSLIVQRVQKEHKTLPDMTGYNPKINFKDQSEWEAANAQVNKGLDGLVAMLRKDKDSVKKQRDEAGMTKKFGSLTSKDFPEK